MTVKATLVIQVTVECPECGHEFDILTDTQLNDEGKILNQLLDTERWQIDADERLKCWPICPHCSVEFEVKGVIW